MNIYKRALSAFLCFLLIFGIVGPVVGNVYADFWSKTITKDTEEGNFSINGVELGDMKDSAEADIKKSENEVQRAFGRSTTHKLFTSNVLGISETPDGGIAGGRAIAVNNELDKLWAIIKDILTWIVAFGEITSVLVCLVSFIMLATAPSHPIQRRNCMINIITSIICAVLLGGLAIILNIFYGTFAGSFSEGVIYVSDWRVGGTIFLAQYGNLVAGFSGIASLTMLLCMGFSFTKLALSGGNPQKKQQAMTGIITTVLATAGVGGITTFVSMLTGILN